MFLNVKVLHVLLLNAIVLKGKKLNLKKQLVGFNALCWLWGELQLQWNITNIIIIIIISFSRHITEHTPYAETMGGLWVVFQGKYPALFGLGTEIISRPEKKSKPEINEMSSIYLLTYCMIILQIAALKIFLKWHNY